MSFQLVGIGVDHDLAVAPAERLRHAGAGHAGDLVAHLKLRQIAKRGLVQALAFECHQAHRKAGRVELQHDRRQRAGRKAAQLRHREIGDGGHRRVRIGSRLEVDFDHAHAREASATRCARCPLPSVKKRSNRLVISVSICSGGMPE